MRTRVELSAGGVIYRDGENGPEVCLIQSEETGLSGEVVQKLDHIEYWYVWNEDGDSTRVHKWVYFYLMRYQDGDTSNHDHEVTDAVWCPISEAPKWLTFESEQNIAKMAAEVLSGLT